MLLDMFYLWLTFVAHIVTVTHCPTLLYNADGKYLWTIFARVEAYWASRLCLAIVASFIGIFFFFFAFLTEILGLWTLILWSV